MALKALNAENDPTLLPKITECVIQIATNVFNIAPSNQSYSVWPDILTYAINVLEVVPNDSNLFKIESGLRLFEGIYGFIYESLSNDKKFNEIASLVGKVGAFTQIKNLNLASRSVKTLSEMIFYASKKELKGYKDWILPIMSVTMNCFTQEQENCLKTCCKALIEMSTDQAAFLFKNHFSDLFILMGKISEKKNFDDENLRELGFEVITNLVEVKPEFFSKDEDKLKVFIEALYKHAVSMDKEITDDWATPTQVSYFDEEFIYEKEVSATISFLERLITSLGGEKMLPILSEYISRLLENEVDWRFKYVGIMSYKHLITHVDDMLTVESLFPVIFSNLKNLNSKIRYACYSTVEELADTFKPHFNDKYSKELIPHLVEGFNDSVLKVQLEACESLNTVMGNTDEVLLASFSELVLDKTFGIFLKDGLPNNLRECLLNVVATLVSQVGNLFEQYANKCLSLICDFFSKSYANGLNKPLYGNLIECITLIGPYDKPTYYKLIPDLVNAIVNIQDNIPLSTDPIRDYLQDALERLVKVCKTDFKEQIPKIIESTMKLVRTIPEISVSSNPEEKFKLDDLLSSANSDPSEVKIKYESTKTSSSEEMASALETLNKVIEALEELYLPYIDVTNVEIFKCLTFISNEDIREISSDTIPILITIIKKYSSKENLVNYAKIYTHELMIAIEREIENETQAYLLENFVELIETVDGYLNKDEVNQFFSKILVIFDEVEVRRKNLLEKKNSLETTIVQKKIKGKQLEDEEEDDEEERMEKDIAEEVESIQDIQSSMSELIGKLFATHKSISEDVVKVILNVMIPKYFRDGASVFESKMGMFLIDDIVEYLGQDYIPSDIWDQMGKALTKYGADEECQLRQAALYGIGMYAQMTKTGFENYAYDMISKIYGALSIPKDNKDEEDWGLARDNAVAALGRIIQYQNSNIRKEDLPELIQKWLKNLPITIDESEMIGQHEFLCDILLNKPELIVGSNFENSVEIVKVVSRIYKSKFSEEKVDNKIKQIVTGLFSTNENFKVVISSLCSSQDEKQQKE